ncbi:hypothetical protein [Corynebacterium halotolerans]|uniref:hypothetical protein n=1 Tax=Corynebacterium halotolerans TaxID=225326 RepID=UPI003CE760EE
MTPTALYSPTFRHGIGLLLRSRDGSVTAVPYAQRQELITRSADLSPFGEAGGQGTWVA